MSSTSNRWSLRTAWRSRRMLFSRLQLCKSFKKVPRELVFSRCMWRVGKQFRPTWTAGGWTPVPRSGDTCGTRRRGSPGGCGGCSTLPFGTSQLLERSFTKTGTDPKHFVRKLICFVFILTVSVLGKFVCSIIHISICFCLVLGNLG